VRSVTRYVCLTSRKTVSVSRGLGDSRAEEDFGSLQLSINSKHQLSVNDVFRVLLEPYGTSLWKSGGELRLILLVERLLDPTAIPS